MATDSFSWGGAQNPEEMGCFGVFGLSPTARRFIAVPFCFSVSYMDVNKGGRDAHQSIQPSISFL